MTEEKFTKEDYKRGKVRQVKVSDKFVEKWTEEFFEVLPNGISWYIKRLLEDYHKELMK